LPRDVLDARAVESGVDESIVLAPKYSDSNLAESFGPTVLDAPCSDERRETRLEDALERVLGVVSGRRLALLTGAGASTESGIPDYRGPGTRARARNPIQYRQFLADPLMRQRYWARSVLGWPRMADARPNPGHAALAQLEQAGVVSGIVTQNVDRLHSVAGSRRVVELHGALAEVVCLSCRRIESRACLQEQLLELNPGWLTRPVEYAPDGDADLSPELVRDFRIVDCPSCGGVLKPHVVFFGEAVPKDRVTLAYEVLDSASALVVVGSSLTVWSGFRFVRHASERGLPIVVVNLSETRADGMAALCVSARSGEILPALAHALAPSSSSRRASG
jgi:NAD-dependent SIR2 family protein deacetylase